MSQTTAPTGCGANGHVGYYHGGCIPCCKLNALAAECVRLRGVVREAALKAWHSGNEWRPSEPRSLMVYDSFVTEQEQGIQQDVNAILAELGVGEEKP